MARKISSKKFLGVIVGGSSYSAVKKMGRQRKIQNLNTLKAIPGSGGFWEIWRR